jgi:hypothetical protein
MLVESFALVRVQRKNLKSSHSGYCEEQRSQEHISEDSGRWECKQLVHIRFMTLHEKFVSVVIYYSVIQLLKLSSSVSVVTSAEDGRPDN